ncbi:MAG: sulfate adenylyltransferase [Epsilonproteobacteria bacterium]|nr:sulfate adenylyltransferase [Campylobacterota bacterium]
MDSIEKNKKLFIDEEAFITLSMLSEGLLYPVTSLMSQKEAEEVNKTGIYKNKSFPFAFILAPNGKRNEEVLKSVKKNDIVELVCQNKTVGKIIAKEVFLIDKKERVKNIYGTDNLALNGVKKTFQRLGNYAISGDLFLDESPIKKDIKRVKKAIKHNKAQKIVGITTNSNPFHRVHERIIRLALEENDMVILFLAKNLKSDGLAFDVRYKALDVIIHKFFPKNKIIIVPLHNTYIFSGLNEVIMDSIVIKNFGCNKFVMGQTHDGLGIHYANQHTKTIFDVLKGINLETITIHEYVYCNICRTIVSTNSCPHGSHHHIKYHSEAILELLKQGIIPPPILIRKELTALYLTSLFKNRFENTQKLYYDLIPNNGIIENIDEEKLYIELIKMYQTMSMT